MNRFGVYSVLEVYLFSMSLLSLLISVSMSNSFWFMFWVDLSVVFLYPCFFTRNIKSSDLVSGLTILVVANSISSSLIIMGLVRPDFLYGLIFLGYMIKFGIFPFFMWMSGVYNSCGWLVLLCLVTLFKCPWINISFILGWSNILWILASATFIVLSGMFWIFSWNWTSCLSYMMISSSTSLLAVLFKIDNSLMSSYSVWVLSSIWSTTCIVYCWILCDSDGDLRFTGYKDLSLFFYVFLAVPLSASFFYKVCLGYNLLETHWLMCVCWAVYGISEQLYVWSYIVHKSEGMTSSSGNWVNLC